MIVFFEGYKSIKFNGSFTQSLYEHGKYNDVRVLLTEQPLYVLTAPIDVVTSRMRMSVCLTDIIIFRTISTHLPIEHNELVYFGLMRLTEYELHLCLYPMSYVDIFDRAELFFNDEPVIVLDLDKTLLVAEHDIPSDMDSVLFNPHFMVQGTTLIDDVYYEHRIMIRPGCHAFLTYLFSITSKVYILTAADLN